MATQTYIADGFEYTTSTGSSPDHVVVSGTSVTITKNGGRYEATYNGNTVEVHVIDFMVDLTDPSTVATLIIDSHTPIFYPKDTYKSVPIPSTTKTKYTFPIPRAMHVEPGFAWTADHLSVSGGGGTPGFALRVTVKRKS